MELTTEDGHAICAQQLPWATQIIKDSSLDNFRREARHTEREASVVEDAINGGGAPLKSLCECGKVGNVRRILR